MEVDIITAALVEGATAIAREAGIDSAVKDSYDALKKLVISRFSDAELEKLEQKPDSEARRAALEEELRAAKADNDPELEKLAQRLLTIIRPKLAEIAGDAEIAGINVGKVIGGSRIMNAHVGGDIVIGQIESAPPQSQKILSSEQALGRIADAVRLNLEQLQLNMEQARRESSQFFRTTIIFSAIAFSIILIGVSLMLANFVTAGIVTTVASVIPESGALLLFNKDKELRKTIEVYHGHILESQRVLTMIDLAETMAEAAAKDSVKEQIVFAVLKVTPPKQ